MYSLSHVFSSHVWRSDPFPKKVGLSGQWHNTTFSLLGRPDTDFRTRRGGEEQPKSRYRIFQHSACHWLMVSGSKTRVASSHKNGIRDGQQLITPLNAIVVVVVFPIVGGSEIRPENQLRWR